MRALVLAPLTVADLNEVAVIENVSFSAPWPTSAYTTELTTNRLARYVGARIDGTLVGFGGIWLMVDEAHVTTMAVLPANRRTGVATVLLLDTRPPGGSGPAGGGRGDAPPPPRLIAAFTPAVPSRAEAQASFSSSEVASLGASAPSSFAAAGGGRARVGVRPWWALAHMARTTPSPETACGASSWVS